ncbi:hypothetical protein JL107_13120 [Nakamurella flavida]|uniref:Uncharacterized protein n=1 Tax=Nakamurella flavida TaxID=363630 RepID=A0A939C157_9ACTN|nr:hypothetical protein [Nakamurella flavida]MBM9477388.1 hypothetical protein [Nakamurella flavida]MDP9777320.1 hypothetical protein [Nakamurella flavida]
MTADRTTATPTLTGRTPLRVVGSSRPSAAVAADDAPVGSVADAVAARTVQILRRAGIQSIVLSRPAVHGRSLSSASRRTEGTLELLVAPWAVDTAQLLLRHHRYTWRLQGVRDGGHPRDVTAWTVPERPDLVLDLYCGFAGVGDPDRFFTEMWKSRQVVPLAGIDASVPGPSGAALLLLLRAAVPGRSTIGVEQIRSAAADFDVITWVRAGAMARQSDARDAVATGAAVLPAGAVPVDVVVGAHTSIAEPARSVWAPGGAATSALTRAGAATVGVVRQALPGLRARFRPVR